jgi:phytoene/squalene synthetase
LANIVGTTAALAMSVAVLDYCAATVLHVDPDRYFSALFAPVEHRPFLYALYALNHELARVGESVHEPMLGYIRLQWWRDALQDARAGRPRRHEVVEAMTAVLASRDVPLRLFEQMIDARALDLSDGASLTLNDLEDYLDATSGNLMRIASLILGREEAGGALARDAGVAYGLVGIVRAVAFHASLGKLFLPHELLDRAGASRERILAGNDDKAVHSALRVICERAHALHRLARKQPLPRPAIAAFLPAALVPHYLRQIARGGYRTGNIASAPLYRRQFALLAAVTRRHI